MKKIFLLFLATMLLNITNGFAQINTMCVMQNGGIVFQSPIPDVEIVTFDEVVSGDALIIQKIEGSPVDTILLNNIQQLAFSDENLSVETSNGNKVYALSNIAKLLFDNITTTGINNLPAKSKFDVLVSFTPAGKIIVESSVAIKSLTLFSVDGKLISTLHCNGVETQYTVSLQDCVAGVYLLRVETEEGTVIKKVVKSFK